MRKAPHPVDVHVGSRVKLRRKLLGFSQAKLGDAVGLTFQQIQKYERGANRMGGSRLYQFGQLLNVPVSFFFDDMPADLDERAPAVETEVIDQIEKTEIPEMEVDALVQEYYQIRGKKDRHRLRDLARAMAGIKYLRRVRS
jgi:transcriptional regulator with XRE-family HTH domain|tara:strand:- start:20 stop:442 length:423 start_codon:yes stop_codon:yes gene_type:complete